MNARAHHAYAVEADQERFDDVILGAAAFLGVAVAGNPDVTVIRSETLGIDESRALADRVQRKPVAGNLSVFIVCALGMTTEAEHALLKCLEEPPRYAVFFIAVPSLASLLPTLRSRLERIDLPYPTQATSAEEDAGKLLSLTPAERLRYLAPIIAAKDKSAALALVSALERAIASSVSKKSALSPEIARAARELATCRGYLLGRSPSVKLILEHLAVTLPMMQYHCP